MTRSELADKFDRAQTMEGVGLRFTHAEYGLAAAALRAMDAFAGEHAEETAVGQGEKVLHLDLPATSRPTCEGACGKKPSCADEETQP